MHTLFKGCLGERSLDYYYFFLLFNSLPINRSQKFVERVLKCPSRLSAVGCFVYCNLLAVDAHFPWTTWKKNWRWTVRVWKGVWSLFIVTNPFGTLENQSLNHILCLKRRTFILCIIQDGGEHVDLFFRRKPTLI